MDKKQLRQRIIKMKEDQFKVSVKGYDKKTTFKVHDGLTAYEFIAEVVVPMMRSLTYQERTILNGLEEYIEVYGDKEDESEN